MNKTVLCTLLGILYALSYILTANETRERFCWTGSRLPTPVGRERSTRTRTRSRCTLYINVCV